MVICTSTLPRLLQFSLPSRLSSLLACRDNQGHLPLFEDFNVFQPRLLQSSLAQRLPSPLACGDNHGHPLFFIFPRLSKFVVKQRQSWSSALYISKTSMSFIKTITVFFTFSRLTKSIVMRRQSWSSAFLYFFKTIIVCCFAETIMVIRLSLPFKDYQSLLSCGDYQCLPLFIFSKTIRVFCFKDNVSFSLQDLEVFY